MKSIGIIGCGHWGKNYLRVFREISEDIAMSVSDNRPQVLDLISRRFPQIKVCHSPQDIFDDPKIEAVVIATPAVTHYELVKGAIRSAKHVLVEKPFTLHGSEAGELIDMAAQVKRVLMVSHTFLYNPAIVQIKRYIDSGDCGKIYYLKAVRTHLGLIRDDVNVFWDLAAHDISIFNFFLGALPISVSAVGSQVIKPGREDVGFATLVYPHGVIAGIHVSWIDSNKERQLSITAGRQRIVFDDLNNLEKIRIFEKGVEVERDVSNFGEFQLLLRDGNIISPKVESNEPLRKQCEHFLDCLNEGKQPLTDGKNGLQVVKALEALQESLAKNGAPVNII
jgi:predicted dehydrogenase